ncbi:MAG: hypothetical protein DCC64_04175 [Planctomycetota bacterium]|nr:MAG: hypothetical protein DCC64_04175 [Planctomycetota bacterium]
MVHGQRQQQWDFSLLLGGHWRRHRFTQGVSERTDSCVIIANVALEHAAVDWAALLPPEDLTGWLVMAFQRRHLTVNPGRAA